MATTWFTVVVLSVAVHLIFLASIFDIYFKSPLVHGMQPYTISGLPPARRLMLFVADGLRADKFFSSEDFNINTWKNSPAAFLKSICESRGVCGVSHTHVPTESRPGHVALIAGFYEDVSAVAKGWKENPVEFDSFFNESRYTWSWGSPDILPMFAKGSSGSHVFINTYNPSEENFAMANASLLDLWVFEKFQDFLEKSKLNPTLRNMLEQDRIVFFLHLLGLDTIGHGNKPTSQEYLDNILLVDKQIEKIVNLFEDYFNNDGLTSYIFTSDHGMTDWGSHGSGSEAETMTPIVAWGAGIAHLQLEKNQKHIVNINQVDIAPLMASLVGVPFPMNSVGTVPLSFLNATNAMKADILYMNSKQILSQCKIQEENKYKTSITFYFRQFSKLSGNSLEQIERTIEHLLKDGKYEEALQKINELISLALEALHYYQTYDRFALSCSIFMSFIGWMIYVMTVVIEKYTTIWTASLERKTPKRYFYIKPLHLLGHILIFIFTFSFLYMKFATFSYYLYFITPLCLWVLIDFRFEIISATFSLLKNYSNNKIILWTLGVVCGLEIIVISFFIRALLSIGLIFIAIWPWKTILKSSDKNLCIIWSVLSLLLAAFPLLPVAGKYTNYNLVCFSGWLFLLLTAYCSRRPEIGFVKSSRRWNQEPYNVIVIIIIQMFILVLAIFIVQNTASSLLLKGGLPYINQIFSWNILVSTFILPFMGSSFLLTRLLHIACSLSATYMLMSTSYESLFLLCLCCLMFMWICLECKLASIPTRLQDIDFNRKTNFYEKSNWTLTFDDIRRAYFSIYFLLTAFFGTGNIASINSFDPASVYAFLTVFSPFIMGALLMLKIMIPFLIVACTLFSITKILKLPPWSLFMIILIMCDFMGLHFFLLVQDTGSWLDIGMSISHYVVMLTATIYFMLLYSISQYLTSKKIVIGSIKSHSY